MQLPIIVISYTSFRHEGHIWESEEPCNQPYAYLYSFITKYPLPISEPSNQDKKNFPEFQFSELKKKPSSLTYIKHSTYMYLLYLYTQSV